MIRNSNLNGYKIPGKLEALKATLFADDTTVYLAENDDFADLQRILDTWCSAAKARFNIGKTDIIPIGEPEYRRKMVETYRETGAWKNYPRDVRMAGDGESVRILGAFFGYGLDQMDVWTPRIAKIAATVSRWKLGHAKLDGRRHATQMIVGGMSQFLADVQRMPGSVVKRLTKIMRNFIWDDRANTPVALPYLYQKPEEGGLSLLDLEARNDAVTVMWLKSYLDFGPNRPAWAYVADDLFATSVAANCVPTQRELREAEPPRRAERDVKSGQEIWCAARRISVLEGDNESYADVGPCVRG
ncbi:hypothetical protein BD309DRAFT_988302 [Dichomitus squalens]|uniref:Reverse transcriptase domain-containing protein n=1 Tax=Dichomitus squalens TaxID=114155 RepID=A0A4Q9Q180_9APHY|nr:hypothetical protein BD311DRAFT_773947 [Dichomitus squalens]TBU47083.1 hypothetical protein BD309DRAFT_988302 [Dichomitus squalens]TBU60750.1 hypothetical protein BD310DRAFT_947041 [Dichomitus squalens]